jgi:hypothetical protein
MSTAWFKLDSQSYIAIAEILDAAGERLEDATPVMRGLVTRWQEKEARDFPVAQAKAAATGTRYARKRRHPPLVKTGRLKEAFTAPMVADVRPFSALVGVETRGARGAWLDGTYFEVMQTRFKVWKPLTPGDRLSWSETLVRDLRAHVAEVL